MSITVLFLATLVSLYFLYKWISRWRMLRIAALTPTLSGYLPIIGHTRKIMGDFTTVSSYNFVKSISEEANENGGVMKGWLGPHLFYVITDPEDGLTIANACLKKHYFYRFGEPFVGEGLFTARSLNLWKRHRKLLIPAFNQHILDSFLVVFNDQSRCLMDRMACQVNKGEFEHLPYLGHNALETICRTALGMPKLGQNLVTKEYKEAVANMFHNTIQRVLRFWLHNDTLYNVSTLKKKMDPLVDVFNRMSAEVMKDRIEAKNKGSEDTKNLNRRFKPFLDLMLELKDQGLLTEQEIRDELDTMIIAGYDTTSTTITFALLMLAAHPDVQNKAYEELLQIFGKTDRDVEKEDLSKLVYLDAVMKETLRLFSIAPLVLRYADNDVKLKNTTIAAGSTICLSIYGIHRHKVWGNDVETFRPERWLNPEELPKTPGAYAAFSIGRRNCIGKTYASMQMKTNLAHILRRYRLSGRADRLVLKVDMILKSESGCEISLQYR